MMTKQRTSRGILLALLLVLVVGVSGCYPVAPDPTPTPLRQLRAAAAFHGLTKRGSTPRS